jgi:hypothetical protein
MSIIRFTWILNGRCAVMAAIADRHGGLHLVALDLTRIDARLRGNYVIERRQAEAPARKEEDAEVLGVAIRGPEKPEDNHGFQEGSLIDLRLIATVGLVF